MAKFANAVTTLFLYHIYMQQSKTRKKKTRRSSFLVLLSFLNPRRFTGQSAQIEQLGAADNTVALHFNLCQTRRMNQECSFYTYAIRNTTYSKCFPYAMISSRNNNAFEHLDSFSLAFDNLYMHTNRITRTKCRDVIAELFIFPRFQ